MPQPKNKDAVLPDDARTRYLLSFLMILVERAGGRLTIDHLSDYAGREVLLSMALDREQDRVTITTK
jgi:hypothetical protein